ncbi:MAG: hypothetical protein GY839_13165 [candidate division Zixibacteria bacterium]|nr:hypothetical protein [candidate division Zixibacteria bacterium]
MQMKLNVLLVLFFVFVLSVLTVAEVDNSGFENGVGHAESWKRLYNDVPPGGCEPPWRTNGGNGGKCAHLGPFGAGNRGCDISIVFQAFNCDGPGAFCRVTFDAKYPAGTANQIASVSLRSSNGPNWATGTIPVDEEWRNYTISSPHCNAISLIVFDLTDLGQGTTTELWIDNVFSSCGDEDSTSQELEVFYDTLEIKPDTSATYLPDYPAYEYLPGDANMANGVWPPTVIGGDVTYLVNYFRSMPSSQACLLGGFYCSADANGDCAIIGSDVTRLVNYFRGQTTLEYCPDYEPAWPIPDDLPEEAPVGWPNCETPAVSVKDIPGGSTK